MQKLIELFPVISENPDLAAIYAVFIMIAASAVLFVIYYAICAKKEKQRTMGLRRRAEERGLMFEEKSEIPAGAVYNEFFRKGHSRNVSNLVRSVKAGKHSFSVFDYSYVTGSGRSRQVHLYACAFSKLSRSSGKFFPVFSMIPENFFHKVADKITHSDVDFEFYPHFSDKYHLTGPSKEKIEIFFKPALLSCLESHLGLEIYSDGENIAICRSGHLKLEEISAFEDECSEIIQILSM